MILPDSRDARPLGNFEATATAGAVDDFDFDSLDPGDPVPSLPASRDGRVTSWDESELTSLGVRVVLRVTKTRQSRVMSAVTRENIA